MLAYVGIWSWLNTFSQKVQFVIRTPLMEKDVFMELSLMQFESFFWITRCWHPWLWGVRHIQNSWGDSLKMRKAKTSRFIFMEKEFLHISVFCPQDHPSWNRCLRSAGETGERWTSTIGSCRLRHSGWCWNGYTLDRLISKKSVFRLKNNALR